MVATPDPQGRPIGQGAAGTKQFDVDALKSNTLNFDGTTTGTGLVARSLRIAVAGDVKFLAFNDTVPQTWVGVSAGEIIPMYVKRVYVTGTTATGILGLY